MTNETRAATPSKDLPDVHMQLAYLPANQAWVFLYGREVHDMQISEMNGFYMFETKKLAKAAAKSCGLVVDSKGLVSVNPDVT